MARLKQSRLQKRPQTAPNAASPPRRTVVLAAAPDKLMETHEDPVETSWPASAIVDDAETRCEPLFLDKYLSSEDDLSPSRFFDPPSPDWSFNSDDLPSEDLLDRIAEALSINADLDFIESEPAIAVAVEIVTASKPKVVDISSPSSPTRSSPSSSPRRPSRPVINTSHSTTSSGSSYYSPTSPTDRWPADNEDLPSEPPSAVYGNFWGHKSSASGDSSDRMSSDEDFCPETPKSAGFGEWAPTHIRKLSGSVSKSYLKSLQGRQRSISSVQPETNKPFREHKMEALTPTESAPPHEVHAYPQALKAPPPIPARHAKHWVAPSWFGRLSISQQNVLK